MRIGDNVQIRRWKRGDRFGRVEKIGRKLIAVRMHASKRRNYFLPKNLVDLTDKA